MSLSPFTALQLSGIEGIAHGFFTREGGVSAGIYTSLNCGQGSRDNPAAIAENRARVAGHFGAAPDGLASVFQVHSPDAAVATRAWPRAEAPQADAMVTATPGLVLGVLTADCAPVLFADAEARVIGAAHAGWQGATGGVLESTLAAMEGLGASRARIVAVVGPTISGAAYEVGEEYKAAALTRDPAAAPFFHEGPNGRPHFDLPCYVADRLARAGVAFASNMGVCTYGNEARLFSYRRTTHRREPDYGRQISAIVLA